MNNLWHERIKRERVCADIAAEREWEIVVGHHNRDVVQRARHLYAPPPDPERRLSDGAYRQLREHGELPWHESARLMEEQQSWNPFVRNAAKKEAAKVHAGQQARYEAELAKAKRGFESGDTQRIEQRVRCEERIYCDYVSASLGLEDQMRQAPASPRDAMPKLETRLTALERAGVARLGCAGPAGGARLDQLAAAVDRGYRTVPEVLRRDVEFAIRKEQRALTRTRSISMDR